MHWHGLFKVSDKVIYVVDSVLLKDSGPEHWWDVSILFENHFIENDTASNINDVSVLVNQVALLVNNAGFLILEAAIFVLAQYGLTCRV